jgi:SH3-like domain-containing protein
MINGFKSKGETMRSRNVLSTIFLVLAMAACNLPSNVPVTETPTLQVTISPTLFLATQTPSQTPPPTNTSPPPLTSTPSVPTVSIRDVPVNCRIGPGTAWLVLSALTVGQTSQIVGKNSDGTWWYIVDPFSSSRNCWVSVSVTSASGNLANIPVVQTPNATVTRVAVDVSPRTVSIPGGACAGPAPSIELEGTIETNGPTAVQWRFETQQGGAMTTQTTDFETFGSKTFIASFTPVLPVTAGTSYWVRLIVTSPNDGQSEVKYTIACP